MKLEQLVCELQTILRLCPEAKNADVLLGYRGADPQGLDEDMPMQVALEGVACLIDMPDSADEPERQHRFPETTTFSDTNMLEEGNKVQKVYLTAAVRGALGDKDAWFGVFTRYCGHYNELCRNGCRGPSVCLLYKEREAG